MMRQESVIGLVLFVLLFGVSMAKFKAFFTTRHLEDDDRTPEAEAVLLEVCKSAFVELYTLKGEAMTLQTLELAVRAQKGFDSERFWRFNQNRLRQLLRTLQTQQGADDYATLYSALS